MKQQRNFVPHKLMIVIVAIGLCGITLFVVRWQSKVGKHLGCIQIERMMRLGLHPDRHQVLKILGRPIHIRDDGTKNRKRYSVEAMWKSPFWGYGWREYDLPVIVDFDKDGRVIRLRYGWA